MNTHVNYYYVLHTSFSLSLVLYVYSFCHIHLHYFLLFSQHMFNGSISLFVTCNFMYYVYSYVHVCILSIMYIHIIRLKLQTIDFVCLPALSYLSIYLSIYSSIYLFINQLCKIGCCTLRYATI